MGILKSGKITVWTVLATTLTAVILMVYSLSSVSAGNNHNDRDDDDRDNRSHSTNTPRPTATPTPNHADRDNRNDRDDRNDHNDHNDNDDCEDNDHGHKTASPSPRPTVRPTATPVATPVATASATNDPNDICPNLPGVQTSLPSKDWYQLDPPSRECREFQYGGPESAHKDNPGTPPAIEGYGVGGQVLGASTMAGTGSFTENLYMSIMILGAAVTLFGAKNLKKSQI